VTSANLLRSGDEGKGKLNPESLSRNAVEMKGWGLDGRGAS